MGLIMNTAVSSTWGFPFSKPDWCQECYDCDDPKCACNFNPGFCQMFRDSDVSMYIDYVRVYQSTDPSAHVGANHTLGCDPPKYPTRDWIKGREYRYMRNPPFSFDDKHPLKSIQKGGASCKDDTDCGGVVITEDMSNLTNDNVETAIRSGGVCVDPKHFSYQSQSKKVCKCYEGYTGPNCRAIQHIDRSVSAAILRRNVSPLRNISGLHVTPFMLVTILTMATLLVIALGIIVVNKRRAGNDNRSKSELRRPVFISTEESSLLITGTSI